MGDVCPELPTCHSWSDRTSGNWLYDLMGKYLARSLENMPENVSQNSWNNVFDQLPVAENLSESSSPSPTHQATTSQAFQGLSSVNESLFLTHLMLASTRRSNPSALFTGGFQSPDSQLSSVFRKRNTTPWNEYDPQRLDDTTRPNTNLPLLDELAQFSRLWQKYINDGRSNQSEWENLRVTQQKATRLEHDVDVQQVPCDLTVHRQSECTHSSLLHESHSHRSSSQSTGIANSMERNEFPNENYSGRFLKRALDMQSNDGLDTWKRPHMDHLSPSTSEFQTNSPFHSDDTSDCIKLNDELTRPFHSYKSVNFSRGAYEEPKQREIPQKYRPQLNGHRHSFRLSQFLRYLLNNPAYNPELICWVDKSASTFKLVNSAAVARLWGAHKQKPNMNYETMGRAMRYYYAQNILRKVKSQRLVYQFLERTNSDHSKTSQPSQPPLVMMKNEID